MGTIGSFIGAIVGAVISIEFIISSVDTGLGITNLFLKGLITAILVGAGAFAGQQAPM